MAVLLALSFFIAKTGLLGHMLYTNSGNNTEGFRTAYGNALLKSDGRCIVESNGGTWSLLPVKVTGDFKITYDILNNSLDGDAHLLLVDPATNGGIDVKNCPQGTDTPFNYIFSGSNFADYNQFFFPSLQNTLVTEPATSFPVASWTHVIITRKGNVITDNVGGQIIRADVGKLNLPATLRVGLGGYATTFGGGVGCLSFRNLTVARDSSSAGSEDETPVAPAPPVDPYAQLRANPYD
jgi:hypothetical protein